MWVDDDILSVCEKGPRDWKRYIPKGEATPLVNRLDVSEYDSILYDQQPDVSNAAQDLGSTYGS